MITLCNGSQKELPLAISCGVFACVCGVDTGTDEDKTGEERTIFCSGKSDKDEGGKVGVMDKTGSGDEVAGSSTGHSDAFEYVASGERSVGNASTGFPSEIGAFDFCEYHVPTAITMMVTKQRRAV